MSAFAEFISALAALAWPCIFAGLIYKFYEPLKEIIESAQGRKITIKVAGNELTVEEASEQQRRMMSDIQAKVLEQENDRLRSRAPASIHLDVRDEEKGYLQSTKKSTKRILWVDDDPKNNSFVIAELQDLGYVVDTALSTEEGIELFQGEPYDAVISDMGRPEGDKAGIDLAGRIRAFGSQVPFYIYCGGWASRHLAEEAVEAGVTEITSSSTTLVSYVLLSLGVVDFDGLREVAMRRIAASRAAG